MTNSQHRLAIAQKFKILLPLLLEECGQREEKILSTWPKVDLSSLWTEINFYEYY